MIFSARVEGRDFAARPPSQLRLRPLRWGWTLPGGPSYAEIEVDGGRDGLWEILTWLRCPLVIYGDNRVPVWWGYVSEAVVAADGIEHRVGLDKMANRMAVAYSHVEPGTQEVGTRRTTAWASDADSVSIYGTKELLASVDGASDARAEGVRDETLLQQRYPQIFSVAAGGGGGGVLVARGWWDTLAWRYYARSSTNSLETTVQASTMVAASAEFLVGTDVLDTTAISYSSYQDGERTMQELLSEWLRTPTSSGERLTAWVTAERRLRIEAEGRLPRWLLFAGDVFRRAVSERGLSPGEVPVGWTDLRGVIPASANLAWLGAPSPFFVEEAEYSVDDQSIRWRPRGQPTPWEIGRLVDG